jgi:hypothetical protein
MSQLDRLIDRILPSQEFLLESQKEPMMRPAAGLKVIVNQPLTSPQIAALLAEPAPAAQKQNFAQKKPATASTRCACTAICRNFRTSRSLLPTG